MFAHLIRSMRAHIMYTNMLVYSKRQSNSHSHITPTPYSTCAQFVLMSLR